MVRARALLRPLALTAAFVVTGCGLVFENGGFQSFTLHFTLTQEIPADQPFEVEVLVHPIDIATRRLFVQISGMLVAPDGEELPQSLELVLLTTAENGRRVERVRKALDVREDGGFLESHRLRRDIPAGAMQAITLEPRELPIPEGTKVWLCVDLVESRSDLSSLTDCSGGGAKDADENTVLVEVRDSSFFPRRARVSVGQTVRWVLAGSLPGHTVTADVPSDFDSGFAFNSGGDFFEVTFGPDRNNRTFLYYCQTHRDCCSMQGSILVGDDAPDPPDGY